MEAVFRLWFLWSEAAQLYIKVAESACADVGLSFPQFSVLFIVKYSTGPVRISDLAHYIHQNPNSISMIVDRMARQGLVRRVKNQRDRRVVIIKLTGRGDRLLQKALPVTNQMVMTQTSVFSNVELAAFSSMLEKFRNKLYGTMEPDRLIQGLKPEDIRRMIDALSLHNKSA